MRLLHLYLRSRLAGTAAVVLSAVAGLAWFVLRQSGNGDVTALILAIAPLGAAAGIGASTRSPFGEAERTASRSLPALRFIHVFALAMGAVFAFALANTAAVGEDTQWVLVRNAVGYTGIALIASWLIGSSLAWAPAVALGLAAFVTQSEAWWAWSARPSTDGSSLAIATALAVVGLIVFTGTGGRDNPPETA